MFIKTVSRSVNDTLKLGHKIARNLDKGQILCLFGELGSGKTVFARGIARGLGVRNSKIVSPSFVLVRQYRTARLALYHLDFYRLNDPQDILALGYEDYLYPDGVAVVEWPERLEYLLPEEHLKIKLAITGRTQRRIEISAQGWRHKRLMEKIVEDIRH